MSEIKNGALGLYGAKHSKCNHMITLGFRELKAEDLGRGTFGGSFGILLGTNQQGSDWSGHIQSHMP